MPLPVWLAVNLPIVCALLLLDLVLQTPVGSETSQTNTSCFTHRKSEAQPGKGLVTQRGCDVWPHPSLLPGTASWHKSPKNMQSSDFFLCF